MVKIYGYILFFLSSLYATEQIPEKLIIEKEYGTFDTVYMDSYPYSKFMDLYYDSVPYPIISSENFRGYNGEWLIKNDSLFLIRIRIDTFEVSLDKIMGRKDREPVFAFWVNQYLIIPKYDMKLNLEYKLLEVNSGKVIDSIIMSEDEFWSIDEKKKTRKKLKEFYTKDKKYEKKYEELSGKFINKELSKEAKKEVNRIIDIIEQLRIEKENQENKEIESIVSQSKGYDLFKKRFTVDRRVLGLINSFPYSVYYQLTPKYSKIVNSVWFWFPIEDSLPKFTFSNTLDYFNKTDDFLASLQWLEKWKSLSLNREIELHIYGEGLGESVIDMEITGNPIWKAAKLKGLPTIKILLRKNSTCVATLFLNESEKIAVISYLSPIKDGKYHVLDSCELSFNQLAKPPKFATIDFDGKFTLYPIK